MEEDDEGGIINQPVKADARQAEQDVNALFGEEEKVIESTATVKEESKGFIDLAWLQDSLKTLQDKKIPAWSNKSTLGYITNHYGVKGSSISEAAPKLNREQAADFVKNVQGALAAALE